MKKTIMLTLALAALIFFTPCGATRDANATPPLQVIPPVPLDVVTDDIPSPAGMAFTPDGSLLVVSRRHPGAIFRVDFALDGEASVTGFVSSADLCNSRYIAVDADGLVYVDTSRPTLMDSSRQAWFARKTVRRAGLFRISPDGDIMTRIENVDADTMGMVFDRKGNLFSCNCAPPFEEEEEYSKLAERTSEKMFSRSQILKPYIMKFDRESGSPTSPEIKIVKRLETKPTDIVFDSKGDLILAAGQNLMKIKMGLLGAGRPKTIASFADLKPKVRESAGIGIDGDDNLYVGLSNPFALSSGIVAKVDPDGATTVLAAGLGLVADIVIDAEGNIYISDMKTEMVFRIPAASRQLQGPFVPPKTMPAAGIARKEPIKKPKLKRKSVETARMQPAKSKAPQMSESEKLKIDLASLEAELRDKRALLFPDAVVLTTGAEIECEIIEETNDSVRIKTSTGTATMMRNRIAFLKYAPEEERQKSAQIRLEIKALESQKAGLGPRARTKRATTRSTARETESERAEAETHSRSEARELLRQAEAGREAAVEDLLAEGIDPDVRDHNRRTPLMLAANKGHNEVVDLLLGEGADIEAQDVDGWTPLIYAAYGGRAETVSLLIDEGADVDARIDSGQSVLDVARQKNRAAVIQLLQEAGAE